MPPSIEKHRYSIDEYLSRERDALDKHEYRDGEILLMAGRSANHSLIVMNVGGEIRDLLRGKPCRVYDSNLRVRIPRTVLYTYPDASIICGPLQIDAADRSGETITNPSVIVEVLSPSTEGYDRGEKFSRYRTLDSLQEYVLVSTDTPRIEVFTRQSEGTWLLTPASGLNAAARLRVLEIELTLAEVYMGVEFPPAEPPLP